MSGFSVNTDYNSYGSDRTDFAKLLRNAMLKKKNVPVEQGVHSTPVAVNLRNALSSFDTAAGKTIDR